MISFVFLLLLIDSYGRGLGNPVQDASNGINLANSLEELAKFCGSSFLSEQIKSQLENCNLPMKPPYKYKHFQCLFFYDINKQLCSGFANVAPKAEDEYKAKLSENITIADICNNISSSWDTQDLPNFPEYKARIPTILQNDVKCGQLCSVPEIITEEVNFYCKYFKWGSDLLHPHAVAVETVENSNIAQEHNIDESSATALQTNLSPAHASNIAQEHNIDESSATALQTKLSPAHRVVLTELELTAEPVKLVEQPTEVKVPSSDVEAINPDKIKSSLTEDIPKAEPLKEVETKPEMINQASSNSQLFKPVRPNISKNNAVGNVDEDIHISPKTENKNEEVLNYNNNGEIVEVPPKKGEEIEGDALQEKASSKVPVDMKPAVIDSPDAKQVAPQDPDDYQDTDEDKDDIEEGEVAPANVETKEYQQTKPVDKRFGASVGDVSEQGLFPPIDGFSDDDGDTFFPFFLTAIILVVVLYVLYHNKSKVSKLILGLLVEGRQTNRRRNSRGHSYRRLDTLEQAMSTTTAAAPSKIIY